MNTPKKVFQIAIIIAVVFAILALSPDVRKNLKVSIVSFLKFPLKTSTSSVKKVKKSITRRNYRDKFVLELENKIRELEAKLIRTNELEMENQRLRSFLDFKKRTVFKTIPVSIIEKDPSLWRRTVIVDKGSGDGICPKMPVVVYGNLVGIVSDVGANVSRVILINDPEFRVSVFIQRTRDEGVLQGSVQGKCMVKYLPLDNDIKVGDYIITSGLGTIFPKGILIGEVVSVEKDRLGLFACAEVKLFADVNRLEELLCLSQ